MRFSELLLCLLNHHIFIELLQLRDFGTQVLQLVTIAFYLKLKNKEEKQSQIVV